MRKSIFKKLNKNFLLRWSPRSFKPKNISEEDLMTIFEAARWAPSCFNEQPWMFLYSKLENGKNLFLEILNDSNKIWAKNASILIAVFSKRTFEKNGKENRWSEFDCGAAWMSISLQALELGYHCHGMAGYDQEKAYSICNVDPKKFNSVCMIAIGKMDSPEKLDEPLKSREIPNDRKDLNKIIFEIKLPTEEKK